MRIEEYLEERVNFVCFVFIFKVEEIVLGLGVGKYGFSDGKRLLC